MAVLMLIATCYGAVQLAALGSLSRSVRVPTLLLSIGLGLYGCGVTSLALQLAYTRSLAALTDSPLHSIVRTASYTVDPVIEEVVKVLPLVLVAVLHRRFRAQWGLTDYLLVGAGIGAGFTLAEALLRFSHRAGSALAYPDGGWLLPVGLSPLHVPCLAWRRSSARGCRRPCSSSRSSGTGPRSTCIWRGALLPVSA